MTMIWQPGEAKGDNFGDAPAPRAKGGVTGE